MLVAPQHRCGMRRAERRPHVNIKRIAGTATLAAALGAGALGLGAGSAQADPKWVDPNIPWIPGDWDPDWYPDWNPGVNWGPPGQVKKMCPGPCGTPPGHWVNGPQGLPIPEGPWVPWVPWP